MKVARGWGEGKTIEEQEDEKEYNCSSRRKRRSDNNVGAGRREGTFKERELKEKEMAEIREGKEMKEEE